MAKGVDFSQFNQFVNDFKVARKDFEPFLRNFLAEMAERLIAKTKKRTPVDTSALRGAWQIGEIKGDGTNLEIEILNGMEYATDVEYGHAGVYVPSLGVTMHTNTHWTSGKFMLTISLDEIQQQMNPRFQKAFKSWAKEKGIGV